MIIEFSHPVMKGKMYFHETRILVDKPEKASQNISLFDAFKRLCIIGYKDFTLKKMTEIENLKQQITNLVLCNKNICYHTDIEILGKNNPGDYAYIMKGGEVILILNESIKELTKARDFLFKLKKI